MVQLEEFWKLYAPMEVSGKTSESESLSVMSHSLQPRTI